MKKIFLVGLATVFVFSALSAAVLGFPWNQPVRKICTPVNVIWGENGRSAAIVYYVREGDVEYHLIDSYVWEEGEESPEDVGLGRADQWAPI
jgi:hypothetical protein